MAGDWLKLHRTLLDSEQMADDWLCRLFIWCLLRANYLPSKFKGQSIEPGQFVTGRVSAAAELRVSPSKWYRGIETLASMGCLTATANSNWTTITVCNWKTYQDSPPKSEQPADSQRTASDTTNGQPADTIEEGKNNTLPSLYSKFEMVSPAIAGIEIDGELVMYSQDWLRWEAEFVRRWNALPKVTQHGVNQLDTFERRLLHARFEEPDWFWKRAMPMFPLWSKSGWMPTLLWFLEFGSVNAILSGKHTQKDTTPTTKGKRNDRPLTNPGQVFDPSQLGTGVNTW